MTDLSPQQLLALPQQLMAIAVEAGALIMDVYDGRYPLTVSTKVDSTPMTVADFLSHQCITKGLAQLLPLYPCISEEGGLAPWHERQKWPYAWVVDPLDGTRGFIARHPEFTVNIALLKKNHPIVGLIYEPVGGWCYYAVKGEGAFKQHKTHQQPQRLQSRQDLGCTWRFIQGRFSQADQIKPVMRSFPSAQLTLCSSAVKFCRLVDQLADIYVRFGPTGEWDTVAGHLLLQEVGGQLVDFKGHMLHYNARDSVINPPFIAVADARQLQPLLASIKEFIV